MTPWVSTCNVPLNDQTLFTYENLSELFSRKAEIWQTWKINASYILNLYHNTYILFFYIDLSTKLQWGWWFNWTHLLLFQNMSVKIYNNFFLFSGFNFKIDYLKEKMNVSPYLLNELTSSVLQHRYYVWQRRSKC